MIILDALNGKVTERPPVWFMRQAGRYMSEYQTIRKSHTFLDMIHNPQLAADITMQPIDAYPLDAAILFSDILTLVNPYGFDLDFIEKKGPVITPALRSEQVRHLHLPNIEETCNYVFEAIPLILDKLKPLNMPLLGFSGAPFTIAAYLIEGGSSSQLETVKYWIGNHPKELHKLLDLLTYSVIDYLSLQIKAGVHAVQLFDTWAGLLSYEDFKEYISPYLHKIVSTIKSSFDTPITVFCKNTKNFLPELIKLQPNCISFDWQTDLSSLINEVPKHIAIQGNLDPLLLFAKQSILEKRVLEKCEVMKKRPGYIFNLGHGIIPKTPVENVRFVADLIRNFRY